MHYRSVPLMMTESAYGGFDWHGDFLQEDSEARMMRQLASAFDDAGLSLTDPNTAVKLLDWNRICRHWQRLRHSMMNQYEIGPVFDNDSPLGNRKGFSKEDQDFQKFVKERASIEARTERKNCLANKL